MRVPLVLLILISGWLRADVSVSYEKTAKPLLEAYCFDCHGDGSAKGEFSMDEFKDLSAHLNNIDHWVAVWRNIRSQIMPPSEKDQLALGEKKELLQWIEKEVFKINPENPDPGRVTIRRLNRQEYFHAIEDLLGVRYNTWENFPPDDTGYGFDTIGDVLSISPLHMEKYLEAASQIANQALPRDATSHIPERTISGKQFREAGEEKHASDWLAFNQERMVRAFLSAPAKGEYEVHFNYSVRGAKQATDQTAHIELFLGEKKIAERTVGWDQQETIRLSGKHFLSKGEIEAKVKITPREPVGENQEEQYLFIQKLQIKGPLDESYVEYPKGYQMIMVDGAAPKDLEKREQYARKIMRSFVSRAFRRPLDPGTIQRLVTIVMETDKSPGKTFEDGLKQAITAVLASPRFLFRAEIQAEPNNPGKRIQLDEYALASRLSFFLWSSVPDDELLSLAYRKELRQNIRSQVNRMLADPKGYRFTNHFVGQWLQSRDIKHWPIDPWRILHTRDRQQARRIFNDLLREDMQRETEMFFDFILKRARPAVELINARYSFLNERLAKFYGINDVKGSEHRLVDLTEHPERGGVLTQGTFLVITSNPTRTSPVKRGLFVLDQILGTPAPPAPPNIPELEEATHGAKGPQTMRQMMQIHREKPSCIGCHARMDPIGLGLENFNAIGQFRTDDRGQKIDSAGELVTGEKFHNVAALKEILATERQDDFFRCLAEKILTYAIGRGVEYYDAATIDLLVEQMKANGGTLKELVLAVIESAPFQMRRGDG